MYTDTRKLHIIDDILRTDNVAVLAQMESLLNESKKTAMNKDRFKEFCGVWTKEEADEISRIIEESCETINPEDWK